jgi:hypothetical protein
MGTITGHLPQDPDHRSRPEDGGRYLEPTVICRIADHRSPRGVGVIIDPYTRAYISVNGHRVDPTVPAAWEAVPETGLWKKKITNAWMSCGKVNDIQ